MKSSENHLRKPQFGVLIKSNQGDMGVMIFSEVFYELGKGTYGKCYIGKQCNSMGEEMEEDVDELLQSSRVVAVKVIPKAKSEEESEQDRQQRRNKYKEQVTNLVKLHSNPDTNCTNIVKIYPFFMESNSNYYIVMEYCHHSNLSELVRLRKSKKAKITLLEFVQIFLDLICGYTALKNNKILHNDLKPQNIFIKNKVFKIGDFGMSHSLKKLKESRNLGSINYMSPQSLINEVSNHKSDIYSLGILLYELMHGAHPYIENEKLRSFYDRMRQEQRENEMAKTKSLNVDFKLSKEKEIDLKLRAVNQYLSFNKNKELNHTVCLQVRKQHEDILRELDSLIKKMCRFCSLDRPTIEELNAKIVMLNLKRFVRREDIFPDLATYSKSERQFQLQNITKEGFSLISKKTIAESIDNGLSMNRTTSGLQADLRDRLRAATSITQLFNDIKEYLQQYTSEQTEKHQKQIFLIMNTYCFYLNEREYHYVQLKKEDMPNEMVRQLESMNLQKLIIVNQQDNDHLEGQVSIPLRISEKLATTERYDEKLVKQREKLKQILKNCMLHRIIDSNNNRNTFLLVLLANIVNCEEKHWKKTSKSEIYEQLRKIRTLMHTVGKKNLEEQDKNTIDKTINDLECLYLFTWKFGE